MGVHDCTPSEWYPRRDSNPRLPGPEPGALFTELLGLMAGKTSFDLATFGSTDRRSPD